MVEWKKLGEICYISDYVSNGSFVSLRENVQYKNEPDYAILIRFVDYSNGFDDSKFVYVDEHAYNFLSKSKLEGDEIIMSNVGSCGLYFRCPKLNKKMSLAPNSILIRSEYNNYLNHWFGSNYGVEEIKRITSKSAMPKFNKTEFKKIQIPIPSKSDLDKIVGILDTFTSSIENLKQQIAQRRKQYEFYRDQLLDLEGKKGVEMKTLGEICSKLTDGSHFSPRSVEHGYFMPSVKDMTNNGFDYSNCKQVSKEDYEVLLKTGCKPQINDVLIAKDGSMLKYVFPVIKDEEIVVLSSIAILTPRTDVITSSYLSHYLKSAKIREKTIREFSSKGGVPRIILKNFKKICICFPSISEQSRIVSILDTFEASIQNLEAQLSQREKQYEYYRNKLLTFE